MENAAAQGGAELSNFRTPAALVELQRTGDAGRLRVVRDGEEIDYWAFVFDRDYSPSRGNDPAGHNERRSAMLFAWRDEDPGGYIMMRAGPKRGEFTPEYPSWNDLEPSPRPWLYYALRWVSMGGEGDIRVQALAGGCDGLLVDTYTDRGLRADAESYQHSGPTPKITCARARFSIDAMAALRIPIREYRSDGTAQLPPGVRPGERHIEIPPQTVPGTHLVIECNGSWRSYNLGCGPPTMAPALY